MARSQIYRTYGYGYRRFDRVLPDESCRLIVGLLRSWSSRKGRGLPLGNLTSQLFANFYLNDLDKEINRLVQGKFLQLF